MPGTKNSVRGICRQRTKEAEMGIYEELEKMVGNRSARKFFEKMQQHKENIKTRIKPFKTQRRALESNDRSIINL